MNQQPNDHFDGMAPEEKEILRDLIARQSNAELEEFFTSKRLQLSSAMKKAAADQDKAALQRLAAGIAAYQMQLGKWNEACGKRASAKLLAIGWSFQAARDDIASAIRGDLPGQTDNEGKAWRDED